MHAAGHHGERAPALSGQHSAPEEPVRGGSPCRLQAVASGAGGWLPRVTGALAVGPSGRFGDGYMITVRTKSSLHVKDVVRFFNRNFPEAVLKVGRDGGPGGGGRTLPKRPLTPDLCISPGAAPHEGAVPAEVGAHLAGTGVQ